MDDPPRPHPRPSRLFKEDGVRLRDDNRNQLAYRPGGTRTEWSDFFQALAAIAGVFLIQWLLAKARLSSEDFRTLIKNKPVLLMKDGEFLEAAMSQTRVSRSSIREKLRGANVARPSKVKAVVLETTGSISVMQEEDFDERLLDDVERIRSDGKS